MSSFAWWGYTGNKHIARVKTGQDNDRSVCHSGRLFTNVHAKNASLSENSCSCKQNGINKIKLNTNQLARCVLCTFRFGYTVKL
ncbi:hypothetical protein Hanom_Chr02g00158111 [Helianthus anomalus]